jgi:hypothetical protein
MSPNLYAPPQHVVSARTMREATEALFAVAGGRSIQDSASELRRTLLPKLSEKDFWEGGSVLYRA